MRFIPAAFAASLILCASFAGTASSAVEAPVRCAAAKLKAAGKRYAAEAKCEATALLRSEPVSTQCLQKAAEKFSLAFSKAAEVGDCPGETAAIAASVEECVTDVVDGVSPTSTTTTTMSPVDSDPPGVVSADDTSATSVAVLFDEPIDASSVQASDFTLDNGATVLAATLQGDDVTVLLETNTLLDGATYTLVVAGVADLAGNFVSPPQDGAQFTREAIVCADHLVISEVRGHGPNGPTDDFVELYNPTASTITLDAGWDIQGTSTGASSYSTRWTGGGQSIPPGRHLLLATLNYSGAVASDSMLSSAIPEEGSLRLMEDGQLVDAVCYAADNSGIVTLSGGAFTCEGAAVLNTNATADVDSSIERKPGGAAGNCKDTGDSAADFQAILPSIPQNLSSAPTP